MNEVSSRVLAALAVLLTAAWLLHAREAAEIHPAHLALSSFPIQLDGWSGVDVPIDQKTRDVLGSADLLLRRYSEQNEDVTHTDLFIAYYSTQRTGDAAHSPKNCLPGSGWYPIENAVVSVRGTGESSFLVNQYVVAKGTERQLVLYWFQAHGRTVTSEYRAKILLVSDAIRLNRSDGSLIRISTPMLQSETTEQAMTRVMPFTDLVIQRLDAYIPR